jgi:integrase
MLTLRKRGKCFHVRGSIRVGRETRIVKEHSTGCARREDAEAYRSRLENELRHEILHGPGGRSHRLTVADAVLCYVNRPGGVKSYDVWRLNQLNEVMGDYAVARATDAWSEFKRVRCVGLSVATVQRFRAIFQAALNCLAEDKGFDAPKIKRGGEAKKRIRVRFLSQDEQERLISSYAPHVRPIAEVLCFEGVRIGEALRLDWRIVSWSANTLYVEETKNGEPRTVTMHQRVRKALHRLWVNQGSPLAGRVFLNRLGKPYADPRAYKLPGGSPIKKAHETACRRAGIADFRVHDWRHHWASWCVMSDIDLETIRQEGGWKSLRMVERYAAVSAEHRSEAMGKRK